MRNKLASKKKRKKKEKKGKTRMELPIKFETDIRLYRE
jgi:hypothetical protein